MDYEKKYDELMAKIESVKKDPKIGLKDGDYYNGYVQKGIRSALDYLLQEESEDERISKAIGAAICGTTAETVLEANGVKLVDALSYLEKPKEQKPNIELIQRSWYMEGYHDRKFGQEPKWIIKTGEGGPEYEENPKYGQMLKEQKPAEWSDKDESYLQTVISEMEANKKEAREYEHKTYDNIILWLKSLRPQPKRGWSEEDKRKIVELKTFIAQCNGFNKENRKKAFDMIDAIRPKSHWKPSEEQMRAVFDASERNDKLGSILRNLYNDLKKL